MPNVGGKKFPYTPAGKAAASAEKKKEAKARLSESDIKLMESLKNKGNLTESDLQMMKQVLSNSKPPRKPRKKINAGAKFE